jgi:hypothetical protein
MSEKRLIETIDELAEWCEGVERTMQITFRVKLRPQWLVRICRKGYHHLPKEYMYAQAVSEDLSEAIEMAFEAYITDEEAENAGHMGEGA